MNPKLVEAARARIPSVPLLVNVIAKRVRQLIARIADNKPDNIVEQSAISTCIAILGRTAAYTGKEATWKSVVGI